MNPLSSAYADAYFVCSSVALIAIMCRFSRPLGPMRSLLSVSLLVPLVVLYLVGMHRTAGVDFDNYLVAYDETGQAIPDLGYTALTWVSRRLGLDFPGFLLAQGLFTLASLGFVSVCRKADVVVVLGVYLIYFAIVRDLSQSRIGLAVALYLLGQTRRSVVARALLYAGAMSIHLTVGALVLTWAFANVGLQWSPRQRLWRVYGPLVVLASSGVVLLDLLSFVDPRISFYLAWDEAAYGAPLQSFGGLVRAALVMVVYHFASRRFRGLELRPYLVAEAMGAAILVGFAQFSIFAARLSNVAISMYPIGLGIVACACQRAPLRRRAELQGAATRAAVVAVLAVLLLRPGSLDAVREVVPSAYSAVADWD